MKKKLIAILLLITLIVLSGCEDEELLGEYVKFSKLTLEENRPMIAREYERLIQERNTEITQKKENLNWNVFIKTDEIKGNGTYIEINDLELYAKRRYCDYNTRECDEYYEQIHIDVPLDILETFYTIKELEKGRDEIIEEQRRLNYL